MKGLRIHFSISPLIGSSRGWISLAAVTSHSVQLMLLPAICSCRSSPIKIYADLRPLHSRNLYSSTYFWRRKLRLFCAMLLLTLVLILECTNPPGINPEVQLNNPPQTETKSNLSWSSEKVSTGVWGFPPSCFELICSFKFGQASEAKTFKSSRYYYFSAYHGTFKGNEILLFLAEGRLNWNSTDFLQNLVLT